MHRRKKQLLGLAGLVLVAVLTAIACIIPAPEASAAFVTEPTTVKVQVINQGELPLVEIKSLENNDTVINRSFKVTIGYTKATKLKVFIKNMGAVTAGFAETDPEPGEMLIDLTGSTCENITYSETEQTCEVTYNLPGSLVGVDGVSFTTRAAATNENIGDATSEDSVAFFYRSAYLLKFGNQYVNNGDPIMEAKMNSDVKSAYIMIVDKDGNAVKTPFDNDAGLYKLDLGQKNGDSLKFSLPLWESEAPSGDYKVILLAYSNETPNFADGTDNNLIAMSTVENVKYEVKNTSKPGENVPDPNEPGQPNNTKNPDRPGGPNDPSNPSKPDDPNNPEDPSKPLPPDTGSLFRDLNISRADYILTGVVAFGLITGFAVFLMIRRSKR